VRWPLLAGTLFVAVAVGLGVREFVVGEAAPAPLLTPVRGAQAPSFAAAVPAPLDAPVLELPAKPAPADADMARPADPGPDLRTEQVAESVTLHDLGLHAKDFALGERWQVGLGLTNEGSAFPNDRISALEIPGGLQATLYDDFGGVGYKLTLGPGTHDLASLAFSDRASSILVSRYGQMEDASGPQDAVVLYEHRGADQLGRGLAWRLELPRGRDEWNFRASRDSFADDQASTAWVPLGFELVLFDGLEASGVALVLGPGLHEIELLGFNDRASSARVRRVR